VTSSSRAVQAPANPETYRRAEVERFLKRAAYFSMFSVPNPDLPNDPIGVLPGMRSLITGVVVHEDLHRFDIAVRPADNFVREHVAGVQILWAVTPDDYEPVPGVRPPRTLLVPFISQQFCTLDGQLNFIDRNQTGFRGFGFGRTFPGGPGGSLRLGAVIDILEGFGWFSGAVGTVVVNGIVTPPNELALNLMVRIMDPRGRLTARGSWPGGPALPAPDATATFIVLLGEVDPAHPVTLRIGPDGAIQGSTVFERLRLIRLTSGIGASGTPASTLVEGPIVGTVSAELSFNPLAPDRINAISTIDGLFSFFTADGAPLGRIAANMVDGRAFRELVPGLPAPVFRFGGFGPILNGDGAFAGAAGLMTLNAAVSVFPRTLSNMYILRVDDPDGRFLAAWRRAWVH
jgi:hypothetical protein